MPNVQSALLSNTPTLLDYKGAQAVYVQIALLSSAVFLPIIAHALHAPVRIILPMHWPVLLAGLLYGWRAGAITGLFAPFLSYLVSGYPLPNILYSMTFELFAYGFFAGILRQKFNVNAFMTIGVALLIGRLVFISSVIITQRASISDYEYFQSALIPGIVPAILQILSLPFLSQWLVRKYAKDDTQ